MWSGANPPATTDGSVSRRRIESPRTTTRRLAAVAAEARGNTIWVNGGVPRRPYCRPVALPQERLANGDRREADVPRSLGSGVAPAVHVATALATFCAADDGRLESRPRYWFVEAATRMIPARIREALRHVWSGMAVAVRVATKTMDCERESPGGQRVLGRPTSTRHPVLSCGRLAALASFGVMERKRLALTLAVDVDVECVWPSCDVSAANRCCRLCES